MKKPKISLLTQDLSIEGGVKTVALFLRDAIKNSALFDLQIISTAVKRDDRNSRNLLSPLTWMRYPIATEHQLGEFTYTHVGANFSEFEFQRYKHRDILTSLLVDSDLIQVVSGSPALGLVACGLNKPVVLQVATRAIVERREQFKEWSGLAAIWRKRMTSITNKLDDLAILNADVVMVENQWMLDYCRDISKSRVIYAPPGVDTKLFSPAASGRKVCGPNSYILSIGRMGDPRKNITLLLEGYMQAFSGVSERPKLLLAGATPPPEKFWKIVREANLGEEVIFIHNPTINDLIRLYQGASCFVLPSDEEGFGMVIIESMACGVPVISTQSGGPDGIIDQGVDGYLVPLNDKSTMGKYIQMLCTNSALNFEMGKRAREKALKSYDLKVAGNRFLDIYQNLIFND